MDGSVGDRVTIESNKVGQTRRSGEVLEVLGTSPRSQFRVRWDDGHESIYSTRREGRTQETSGVRGSTGAHLSR
jgi:Domain of unknown function (DUF1918)